MLEVTKSKLGDNVKLQKSDVHNLPFENNIFDYVITTEAFHHYYDQMKVIGEMKRVTKQGAKIIVVDRSGNTLYE